jgi:hypothetical protein
MFKQRLIELILKECLGKATNIPFDLPCYWRTNYWVYIDRLLAHKNGRSLLQQSMPINWRGMALCSLERDFASVLQIGYDRQVKFAFPEIENRYGSTEDFKDRMFLVGGVYDRDIMPNSSVLLYTDVSASGTSVDRMLTMCERFKFRPSGVMTIVDCCPNNELGILCKNSGIPYMPFVTAKELGIDPAIAPPGRLKPVDNDPTDLEEIVTDTPKPMDAMVRRA